MDTVSNVFGVKTPKPFASKLTMAECTNPELLVGLELEVENCRRGLDEYMALAAPLFSVTEDGSLRPRGQAWEFISRPIALGHALPELEAFFKNMKFNEANYTDRCSVHVHANVTDFTQENLATLAVCYVPFEEVLFRFVNHYKVEDKVGASRDTNLYCIPWNQCRMNSKLVDKIFHNPGEAFHKWQKYTALNLLPILRQGTVEWRHMHGTADMEKLTKWLNIIGSIMKFAKQAPFDDVVKTIKELNDTSAYRQFFSAVLGDSLEYDEQYQSSLSEGVLNAKYSMMDWEPNKKKGVKASPVMKKEDFDDEDGDEEHREEDDLPPLQANPVNNIIGLRRDNPWQADPFANMQARVRVADEAARLRQQAEVAQAIQPAGAQFMPMRNVGARAAGAAVTNWEFFDEVATVGVQPAQPAAERTLAQILEAQARERRERQARQAVNRPAPRRR